MSRIVRNTFVLTGAHIVTKILAVAMAIAWARFLGPEKLGQLSVILSIAAILAVITDAGINLVTVREVSRRPEMAAGWFRRSLAIKAGLGAAFLLLLFPISRLAEAGLLGLPLMIAGLAVVVESPMHLVNGVFRAFQRMELEAITVSAWRFGVTALTILILATGGGVTGVTAGLLGGAALGAAVAFGLLRGHGILSASGGTPPRAAAMMKLALPYGLQAVLATIYFRIDIVMLSHFRGDQETGLYQAAYHLIEGILFIPYALSAALLPALSENFAARRLDEIGRRLNSGLKAALVIGMPAAVGLWLTGRLIAPWIFGSDFADTALFLAWLAPAIPLMFLSLLLGTAVGAVDRQIFSALATGLCVLINVTLNLILIPKIGGRGAALSTVIAEIVLLAALAVPLVRSGAWRPAIPAIPAILASTILMGVAVHFIGDAGPVPAILAGAVVYGGALLLLRGVTIAEARDLIRGRR